MILCNLTIGNDNKKVNWHDVDEMRLHIKQ